uniref:Uncharacterized protein n=1 Tax=Arundo donax TaxID=35708 RepID=A0A0A9F8V4_ARUDO
MRISLLLYVFQCVRVLMVLVEVPFLRRNIFIHQKMKRKLESQVVHLRPASAVQFGPCALYRRP